MLALDISPATILVGLLLLAGAALAVRRLAKRGSCDCHGSCGDAAKDARGAGCVGCAGCGAGEQLVANMERQVSGK